MIIYKNYNLSDDDIQFLIETEDWCINGQSEIILTYKDKKTSRFLAACFLFFGVPRGILLRAVLQWCLGKPTRCIFLWIENNKIF